jgi:Icc-related predicted phosphoesterase
MPKIFFATDIHGSDVCWRKFLNAGPFYGADLLIMGGDMTGKAIIPIVKRGAGYDVVLQETPFKLETDEDVRVMEKRIMDRGYYPVRMTAEEADDLQADPKLLDEKFSQVMMADVERWMDIAEEKLRGTGIRCFVCPANDDVFEIDKLIAASDVVEEAEGKVIDLGGFRMASMGWTTPTPWDTWREEPEDKLRERIDRTVRGDGDGDGDMSRMIFNFHVPPYGSNLDEAPALDENMKYKAGGRALIPVGSTAVRDAIMEYQPMLSLHGHIHEGKGAVKLGKTLAVNPGSTYEDGVLQAAVIDLDSKKGKIKNYILVNG